MKEVGRSHLAPTERSSAGAHQLVILPRRVGQAPPPRPPPPLSLGQAPSQHINTVGRPAVGRRLATSATTRTRPTRSASPPTQELVSLDNPRPPILRGTNDYSDVRHAEQTNRHQPDQTASRGIGGKQRHASNPGTLSWTNPSNFDRPKVHHTNSAGGKLGEIKPLVRTTDVSKQPPSTSSRKSQSDSSKLHLNGGVPLPVDHLFEGDFHDLRTLVGEARPASSPPSLSQHSVRRGADRPALPLGAGGQNDVHAPGGDILCRRCGLCRCSQCSRPRALPSSWICHDSCLVSSQCLVDAASCMCSVRACLYHCLPEDGGAADSQLSDDDALFSCDTPGACGRWTCLAAAAVFLPCIWCYLPFKACAAGVQSLYSRYHDHGCRCDRRHRYLEQRHSLSTGATNSVISQQPTKLHDDSFDQRRYVSHTNSASQHHIHLHHQQPQHHTVKR